MKYLQFIIAAFALLFISACAVEPEPIHFGKDACSYCKMTIVDNQHASEFVTSKGKVYKFDAIECMLNQMKTFDEAPVQLLLVSDYSQPGELCDATSSSFLISSELPSPMGANLTAFKVNEDAVAVQEAKGGEIFTWSQMKEKFEVKK